MSLQLMMVPRKMPPTFRFTNRQNRSLVSFLFGLTFVGTVVTVAASDVLPCPVRPIRHGLAESNQSDSTTTNNDSQEQRRRQTVIVQQQRRPRRRWIEEKPPSLS